MITITKQGLQVLRKNPTMLIYLILSNGLIFLFFYYILRPFIHHETPITPSDWTLKTTLKIYACFFLLLFLKNSIAYFFQGAALESVSRYFLAEKMHFWLNFKPIFSQGYYFFAWFLYLSTVGVALNFSNLFSKKINLYQKSSLFFGVSLALHEKKAPLEILSTTKKWLTQYWHAPNIHFRVSVWLYLLPGILMLPFVLGIFFQQPLLLSLGIVCLILSLISNAIRHAILLSFCAALYLYAKQDMIAPFYSRKQLEKAFAK